jgi:hypothetical protein
VWGISQGRCKRSVLDTPLDRGHRLEQKRAFTRMPVHHRLDIINVLEDFRVGPAARPERWLRPRLLAVRVQPKSEALAVTR